MRFDEPIKGIAFQDEKTKRLVERLPKNSIAVVMHQDLDMTAAEMLINCEVKAVLNLKKSMSGLFIHQGVELLLNANIPIFDIDVKGPPLQLDGKPLIVKDNWLYIEENGNKIKLSKLYKYDLNKISALKKNAKDFFPKQFKKFVKNTFYYGEQELDSFVNEVQLLPMLRQIRGKEVLVVARGASYEKDLKTIRTVIKKKRLKIIAVDGAADGLLKVGVRPDFIIGDMDSVSKNALRCGAELLVHSYRNGHAPGEGRVKSLQLPYKRFAFLGTSEDVALIFAYCAGAQKLYTIGTRMGMNEFLEKGRNGMGSSVLTKMKVGHVLVDLKGIHNLFEEKNKVPNGMLLVPAAGVAVILFSFSGKFSLFLSIILQWWSDLLLR